MVRFNQRSDLRECNRYIDRPRGPVRWPGAILLVALMTIDESWKFAPAFRRVDPYYLTSIMRRSRRCPNPPDRNPTQGLPSKFNDYNNL